MRRWFAIIAVLLIGATALLVMLAGDDGVLGGREVLGRAPGEGASANRASLATNSGDSQLAGSAVARPPLPPELLSWRWLQPPVPFAKVDLTDERGAPVSWSDYDDKAMLVNFWATWCGPCRHEMPDLERLQQEIPSHINVVTLNIERNAQQRAREFFNEIGVAQLPLIFAAPDAAARYRIRGLPATLLINRRGQEVARLSGPAAWGAPAVSEFIAKAAELN